MPSSDRTLRRRRVARRARGSPNPQRPAADRHSAGQVLLAVKRPGIARLGGGTKYRNPSGSCRDVRDGRHAGRIHSPPWRKRRQVEFGAESAPLGLPPCRQWVSWPPARGHDQFHVQFWSGFYETTWASRGLVTEPRTLGGDDRLQVAEEALFHDAASFLLVIIAVATLLFAPPAGAARRSRVVPGVRLLTTEWRSGPLGEPTDGSTTSGGNRSAGGGVSGRSSAREARREFCSPARR